MDIFTDKEFAREADRDLVNEYLIEIKRELRKWAHRKPNVLNGISHRIVKDNADWFIELVKLPDNINNEACADRLFHEQVYMERLNSNTGWAFTSWYKLFKRGGVFHAYHCIRYNV